MTAGAWRALAAPAATPAPIIQQLYKVFDAVLKNPQALEEMKKASIPVVNDGPDALKEIIAKDAVKYTELTKDILG